MTTANRQPALYLRDLATTNLRLLSFRLSREEFAAFSPAHLAWGLFWTWIAGIGRYWDDPGASVLQHTGLGSVIYALILAWLLWLVAIPLRTQNWSYRHVLTFVSLTAPPAVLYAIPVERWMTLAEAQSANVWFLAIVAGWRLSLLFFYFGRHARLSLFARSVATFLPMTAVVTALTVLNLERAVFDVMGGLRRDETSHDAAYRVLITLTFFSAILFLPLFLSYGYLVWRNRRNVRRPAVFPDS